VGRRKDVDGRELLLSAALSLFAEQGVDAVSIRAVNRAAGLGPASVHYHFGTKEALLDAVVNAHNSAVVDRVRERANEIAESPSPAAHDLVLMLAAPYMSLLDGGSPAGCSWVQLASQLLQSDPDRVLDDAAVQSVLLAATRVYPNAADADVRRAMRMCITLLISQLASSGKAGLDLQLLFNFLSAGLDATLSEETPAVDGAGRRARSA
jgi:AcrR family transcriptional regulator